MSAQQNQIKLKMLHLKDEGAITARYLLNWQIPLCRSYCTIAFALSPPRLKNNSWMYQIQTRSLRDIETNFRKHRELINGVDEASRRKVSHPKSKLQQ